MARAPVEPSPLFQGLMSPALALSVWLGRYPAWPLLCFGYYGLAYPRREFSRGRPSYLFIPDHLTIDGLIALGCVTSRELHGALNSHGANELMTEMIEALRRGECLWGNVNEYYIPGTHPFSRYDFRHPLLVTAWNPETLSFTSLNYTGRTYQPSEIPAAQLLRALRSNGRLGGLMSVRFHQQQRLQAISMVPGLSLGANAAVASAQIERYLNGEPPLQDCFSVLCQSPAAQSVTIAPKPYACAYGIRTWENVRSFVDRVTGGQVRVDMRPSRVLLEHKQIMELRLKEMQRTGMLSVNLRYAERYQEVIKITRRLHYAMLEKATEADARRKFAFSSADLAGAAESERDILSRVCASLRTTVPAAPTARAY